MSKIFIKFWTCILLWHKQAQHSRYKMAEETFMNFQITVCMLSTLSQRCGVTAAPSRPCSLEDCKIEAVLVHHFCQFTYSTYKEGGNLKSSLSHECSESKEVDQQVDRRRQSQWKRRIRHDRLRMKILFDGIEWLSAAIIYRSCLQRSKLTPKLIKWWSSREM